MDKYKIKNINKEEKDLLNSIKRIDTKTLKKPAPKEQKMFKAAAKNFIDRETKMNIRINPIELSKIKEKAKKEGLKYSTLVKSVIHKYITGQLVEKSKKVG